LTSAGGFRDCGLHQQTATIKPITRSGETARSMNPVAIFFIVFFLSFQANYLYIFVRGIQGDYIPLVLVVSSALGLLSAYEETEWTKSRTNKPPN